MKQPNAKHSLRFVLAICIMSWSYTREVSASTPSGMATAIIGKEAAVFWFPVENADRTWSWGEGFPGGLQYAWKVKASLMEQEYEFGYTKWNPPPDSPGAGDRGEGSLQELLLRGQVNMWIKGRYVKGAHGISATREGQGVAIRLTESDFLKAFLTEMPEQVIFETTGTTPKPMMQTVEVAYASRQESPITTATGAPFASDEISMRILSIAQSGEPITKEEAIRLLEEAGGRYIEITKQGETNIMISLPTDRSVGDEIPAIASYIPGVQILALGTPSHTTDMGLSFIKRMDQLEMLTVTGRNITDAGVAQLYGLSKLQSLRLNNAAISDAGLKGLSGMENLTSLTFMNTKNVTDTGLAHLSEMTDLEVLQLFFVPITDDGLGYLSGLENLKSLSISHSPITDTGLLHLYKLKGLKALFLVNTQVTPEAANRLKASRPDLTLPKILTDPCAGSREILTNTKRRWAQKEHKEDGALPTQADLNPLLDINFTGGFASLKCEDGGEININPVGEPPSCSIHGTEQ